jgi:hypothetical protein
MSMIIDSNVEVRCREYLCTCVWYGSRYSVRSSSPLHLSTTRQHLLHNYIYIQLNFYNSIGYNDLILITLSINKSVLRNGFNLDTIDGYDN